LDTPTAFEAGDKDCAITGALTSEAAATAAREILPKRIIMLLIVESALHSKCQWHSGTKLSTFESPLSANFAQFIGLLQIQYTFSFLGFVPTNLVPNQIFMST
jgi:hypothetical protein